MRLNSNSALHLAAILLLVAVTTLQVSVTQPLTDPFQEGEYVTFGFLKKTRPDFRMPILIHGGMDIVPSELATVACRADSQLVCVRSISVLIQFGTACLFVAVLTMVAGLGTGAALFASLPAAMMLWLYNGSTLEIVDSHGSIPGIRDMFLMAGLLVMAGLCQRFERGKALSAPLLLALGCLAGVGLFWAYNRGLVLGLVTAAFSVGLSLLHRSPRPIIFVALGGAIGLVVVLAAGGIPIITDTVFNITYWSHNQAIWHTPLRSRLAAAVLLISAIALVGAALVAWQSLKAGRLGRMLLVGVLTAIYLLYLTQSLNRPDVPHMREVIWPAMLILAAAIRVWLDQTDILPMRSGGIQLLVVLLLVGACIEDFSRNSSLQVMQDGLKENAKNLIHRGPTDRSLASDDMNKVADLVAANGNCTFAANNAGIIYLLSRVPPCSRFAFGIYVAPDRQTEVIKELEATQPSIILWDSSKWYSHVDDLSFRDRTPILADWIENHYPVRTVIGQQVLLSRAPLAIN